MCIRDRNCGTIPDGCGGTLTCGSCTAPATCGGGGVANVCGGGTATTFGPTGPVGVVPTTCTGVDLHPGDDVPASVSAHAEGTTFCFHAGTYHFTQAIVPKSNDT